MGKLAEYWKRVTGEEPVVTPASVGTQAISSIPDADAGASSSAEIPAVPSGRPRDDPRRRLESFGISHVGKVRAGNEDHFVVASLQRSLEVRQTNLEDRRMLDPLCGPKAYLFAVADGVGGQEGGRLASGVTLQTVVGYLSETVGSYHAIQTGQERAFLDPLRQAVQRAHDNLQKMFGGLTRDQTLGAYLTKTSGMSETQAEAGGFNDVLASAIGAPELTPVVTDLEMEAGDILLLCTDGLTKHVPETQIAEVLRRVPDAEGACRELVDRALAGGGKDNITAVVVNALRP